MKVWPQPAAKYLFKESVAVAVVFCSGAEIQSGWRDGIRSR
jgi:hypothetical protein